MDSNFLKRISQKLPQESILTDEEQLAFYSKDTSAYQYLPELVLLPTEASQIAFIVNLCNEYEIPLTTRGLGSGTTGAAVPIQGGIVLSLQKMNKILKVDPDNRVLIAEAGVTNETIQNTAEKSGFFWAPDPGSRAICTLGGNLACNAAGPRAIKYGTCRENTLSLKAITGSGQFIKTGAYTTKNAVGYDLTQLLIGSEGTLAIITEAALKLRPLPEAVTTLQLFYKNILAATQAVRSIMCQPLVPAALEYVDGKALRMISAYANVEFPLEAQAMLIVEIDGLSHALCEMQEKIAKASENEGLILLKKAKDKIETQKIWSTRRALSPALKTVAPKKINEDVVVPVASMPILINEIERLGNFYKINIINFGHAGNGNIHVNLMIDPKDEQQVQNAALCLEDIFDLVISLDGSLSGEHGIGLDKKRFMTKQLDSATLDIMRSIKKQFDPKGILNPGKILP